MAFPWIVENNWETGLHGADAQSGSLMDFPHFSVLANANLAPYRGAYCMRVRLTGGTTSQYVRENGVDMAADANNFVSWYFYLGKDLLMADADKFTMVELESTQDTTTEVAAGIQRTGSNIEFWYNETQAAASPTTIVLGTTTTALGRWYHAELAVNIDAGGGNDGDIIGYINGVAGATIGTLDQAAIVDARIGTIGPDAGTSGTILIDNFIHDDARIYPHKERFPYQVPVTADAHIFVGPGDIASAALLTTGASNIMRLWDTDQANTDDTQGFVAELDLSAFTSVEGPLHFERGCYVTLSGTNPRGQVMLVTNSDTPGVVGPTAYSERGMIQYGQRRKGKGYGI